MVKVIVSDHAVLRYIERHYGMAVEKLRDEISGIAYPAAKAGAANFQVNTVKFCLTRDPHNTGIVTVKTVMERWMKPNNHHTKKHRRKELP